MKHDQKFEAIPGVELFPIRTVSSLTGVNSITLRAWERRYGLVQPIRTPTGHRLYRQDEIDLIHRVVALLEKGISISQVRQALERSSTADTYEDKPEEQLWGRLRQRMATALLRFDEETLNHIYNEALAVSSIEQVTHHLLMPLLRELTQRSEAGEGGDTEAAFYTVYLRNKLGARLHHRTPRSGRPRFLGACLPGDSGHVELLLFALAALEAGLTPVLLDVITAHEELASVVHRGRCKAIVLSGTSRADLRWLSEQLPQLCRACGVPVFVGGTASVRFRDQLVAAGAAPLGNDLATGTKRVRDALASPVQKNG